MNWDLYPRRPLRSVEIQTWEEFKSSLNPYIPTQGKDYPIWNLNTNRSFSIVSVQTVISDRVQVGSTNIDTKIYQDLWKSTVPEKCKFFVCSLLHECINTIENLQRRLSMYNLNPSWCVLCKSDKEDMNHIFNTCSYTLIILFLYANIYAELDPK